MNRCGGALTAPSSLPSRRRDDAMRRFVPIHIGRVLPANISVACHATSQRTLSLPPNGSASLPSRSRSSTSASKCHATRAPAEKVAAADHRVVRHSRIETRLPSDPSDLRVSPRASSSSSRTRSSRVNRARRVETDGVDRGIVDRMRGVDT